MTYKILAIDDHPETLDIVVTTLRGHGYQVVGSLSPIKGLSLAEKIQPDLVLVDMNMPEIDGNEVCRRLRAHPRLRAVPIIMFTAEAQPHQKLSGFDAGADDYLTKPTEPDVMIARIEAMLEAAGKPPLEATESRPDSATLPNQPRVTAGGDAEGVASTVALPTREMVFGVMGVRGGAGATTVAINLAVSVAQMGISTILMDLDLVQGHIAMYLNQGIPGGGLNGLAQVPAPSIRQQLPRHLVAYRPQLQLLLGQSNLDGQQTLPTSTQVAGLLELLAQPGHCIVADLGCGARAETQPVLDRADHVLVCVRPERVALTSARLLLDRLRDSLFPHTTLSALIFNVNSGVTLPREAVQDYLGHPLLGIINVDARDMARAANKAVPLTLLEKNDALVTLFQKMTSRLVTT